MLAPKKGQENQKMLEKMLYRISRPLVKSYVGTMLDLDVKWKSPLPEGAKIIAANHPSTSDPFFMAAMANQQSFILIKGILFKVPVFGQYLRKSGHIPAIKGQGQAAIDEALGRLADGGTIIIFPEGRLSPIRGGFYQPRTGVARLALASGAPVIPAGIHLDRSRFHTMNTPVEGDNEVGRWYLKGPYGITMGNPVRYTGDAEDREHVRRVATVIMHQIIELSYESRQRKEQAVPVFPLPQLYKNYK